MQFVHVAAFAPAAVPARHCWQLAEPDTAAEPAGHGVQVSVPEVLSCAKPALHWHWYVSVLQVELAWQHELTTEPEAS